MFQLTQTIEPETVVARQPIEMVEATESSEPKEPIEAVERKSSLELLEIVNLMEIIKDPSQFSYCLNLIANDHSLTPTNKSFLTTVANIGIERGTSEIITDDIEIAAKCNRNPRTVRRWITRSIALGKISRHIIDYGTGKYCIRFLHNFLTNLSENQHLTTKIDTSLCPTKPISTRGRKPKAKASDESTIINQINNQTPISPLEAPSSTPTATTPHLALPALGQVDSIGQNLTPLMQLLISSSTPLPTDKILEQLSQSESQTEPSSAIANNQPNIASISSISSIKSAKPTSYISAKPNNNFIGVARTATFGNVLIAQKEATLLQEQLEEAENLFDELIDEQQDLILSITGSIQTYWDKINKITQLETKWKKSKSQTSFDDFLNEQSISESKLLYRKQYLNFITTNSQENAIELAIASLLEKWESIILPPVTTPPTIPSLRQLTTVQSPIQPTTVQPNTNSDIIIKPSIQDIISTSPEITSEISTSSLPKSVQSEIKLNTMTENLTLDTFNQSAISQNNQNAASQTLETTVQTTKPVLEKAEQPNSATLDTFNIPTNQDNLPIINSASENTLANSVQSDKKADNEASNGSQNVILDSVFPKSLKGDCFGQHCPTINDTLLASSITPNIIFNTGTDNNTGFSPISAVLASTCSSTNIQDTNNTTTIETGNSNLCSDLAPTTTPTSNDTSTCFKALKLSSLVDLNHDLEEKEEEKKSLSLALEPSSGTNNSSSTITTTGTSSTDTSTSNTNTSTNNKDTSTNSSINSSASSSSDTRKAKLLSDLKTNFGYDPSQVETVTRGDESCVYCEGAGKLYDILTVTISTTKGEKQESFRDQRFIPCICAKLYNMLEFAVGNVIVLGVPTMTQAQLATQQKLISHIDEKLKAKVILNQQDSSNSVQTQSNKQPAQQAKTEVKSQTKAQVKVQIQPQQPKSQAKSSVNSSRQIKHNTASNAISGSNSDTLNAENNNKTDDDKTKKAAKNYNVEKLALSPRMLAMIQHLNSTAHTRLDDKGKPDLVILTTNDKKYCIVPNPYDQFRKSEFSFLEWLLYAAREPNRALPVRMACQRYYVGKKDAEMITWKKQQAELNVGGSTTSYENNQDDDYSDNSNYYNDLEAESDNNANC